MVEILGVRRVDYKNKENRQVTGYSIHVGESDPRVTGLSVYNFFLSDERFKAAFGARKLEELLNQHIEVNYNRYGRPDSVSLT